MEIVKYTKKGNGNYQITLDIGKKYNLNEDLILKYNLLYKKEIDENILKELLNENNKYDIYNKCVKYIAVRLRSVNEMRLFMQKKNIDSAEIEKNIDRLIKNNLLNDEMFAKAFIKDKLNFTTMGPYRILKELELHNIDKNIINKYIYEIDEDFLCDKINKQINKIVRANKNKVNLRDRVYKNLLTLGYSNELIVKVLNNYNF